MTQPSALTVMRNRAAVAEELRRLLPRMEEEFPCGQDRRPGSFQSSTSQLPRGGLPCGAVA